MTNDIPKIPAEAKEIIKNKRTGKIYASKVEFDADVNDPNTDTTAEDLRQDLEITVTRAGVMGAFTKK
jgi:tRNA U54 and U55 pseudouridine synthase Pus10